MATLYRGTGARGRGLGVAAAALRACRAARAVAARQCRGDIMYVGFAGALISPQLEPSSLEVTDAEYCRGTLGWGWRCPSCSVGPSHYRDVQRGARSSSQGLLVPARRIPGSDLYQLQPGWAGLCAQCCACNRSPAIFCQPQGLRDVGDECSLQLGVTVCGRYIAR